MGVIRFPMLFLMLVCLQLETAQLQDTTLQ